MIPDMPGLLPNTGEEEAKILHDQQQLVKTIQLILGIEERRLQMMRRQLETMKEMKHYSAVPGEKDSQPKQLRINSPSSINRNYVQHVGPQQKKQPNTTKYENTS